MIVFEEAYKITIDAAITQPTEQIDMLESVGRILAEDVISDINMPPFDKTAVDGYACNREDIHYELEVIEVVPAGFEATKSLGVRQCVKIMTGAPIPRGADCVLMVEHTEETAKNRIRFIKEDSSPNICYLAEDVKKGSTVLKKGKVISPQDIAMFASVGYTNPKVYKQPKVAVISTGNELVEPDQIPGSSKIRNSNAYQLLAQVKRAGGIPHYLGIALDDEKSLSKIIAEAISGHDISILTGGVSMGDFDLVPQILKESGIEILYKSIAVQPGRPTLFGRSDNGKFVFGLPGNPVSSFVQFELLVKPFIHYLMGNEYHIPVLMLPLAEDYSRKKKVREKWEPGIINEQGQIARSDYHGSAHIHALSHSDILFRVPMGVGELKKGELVDARQI